MKIEENISGYFNLIWVMMASFSDINSKSYKGEDKYDNFSNFEYGIKTINKRNTTQEIYIKDNEYTTKGLTDSRGKKDRKMCKAVNQNSTKENLKANRYIKRCSTSLVFFLNANKNNEVFLYTKISKKNN